MAREEVGETNQRGMFGEALFLAKIPFTKDFFFYKMYSCSPNCTQKINVQQERWKLDWRAAS